MDKHFLPQIMTFKKTPEDENHHGELQHVRECHVDRANEPKRHYLLARELTNTAITTNR